MHSNESPNPNSVASVRAEDLPESSAGTHTQIDRAVAEVVVDILLDSGPDAVNMTAVSEPTGLAVETLEEMYGHPGELLHLAWDTALRVEFEAVVAQARTLMSGRFDSIHRRETVSPRRRAAVHLLVVAHRFDELKEVVPFDVQRVLFEYENDCIDDCDRSVLRALIGWLCGVLLDPGRDPDDALVLLSDIGWHDRCWRTPESLETLDDTPAVALTFDEAGELSRTILLACTRIVAEGGVSRATLVRIARSAGYPAATVYDMFGRQEHLLAKYVQFVFAELLSYRRLIDIMADPSLADMRLRVWLEPNLNTRRRSLLECVMASNYSPFLKTAYVDALEEAIADVQVASLRATPARALNTHRRFVASRHLVMGLAVLDDVELASWPRHWTPFLKVFLSDGE